jgi:hypothetical protein
MVEREPELSPELVLVSPDLRERALLEERDGPVAAEADVDAPTASAAPAPRVPSPPPPAAPPAGADAGRAERRPAAWAVTAIVVTALVLFGAGIAVGKLAFPTSTARSPAPPRAAAPRPTVTTSVPPTSTRVSTPRPATSTARPPAAPRAAAPRPTVTTSVPPTSTRVSTPRPATSTARSQAAPRAAAPRPTVTTSVPPTSSSASTTVPAQQPKPSTAPPRAKTLPAKTVRPIPNGGYVFSDGRFRLSGTGRRILDFVLRTTCSGSVTLPPIQVAGTGAFTFSGRPPGASPGTTVRVTGRFVSPAAVRGTARVTRGTCHDPARAFAAHLS